MNRTRAWLFWAVLVVTAGGCLPERRYNCGPGYEQARADQSVLITVVCIITFSAVATVIGTTLLILRHMGRRNGPPPLPPDDPRKPPRL